MKAVQGATGGAERVWTPSSAASPLFSKKCGTRSLLLLLRTICLLALSATCSIFNEPDPRRALTPDRLCNRIENFARQACIPDRASVISSWYVCSGDKLFASSGRLGSRPRHCNFLSAFLLRQNHRFTHVTTRFQGMKSRFTSGLHYM